MPAFITIVKSICISLTAAAAVFSASKMDYPVKPVSPNTDSEITKATLTLKIAQLCFSPDSNYIAVLAGDRLLSNWPVAGGNATASTLIQSMPLTCLEWDATGNNLYVGTSKSQILLCDPKTLDINFRIHSKIEIVNHLNNIGLPESLLSFGNNANHEGKLAQIMPQLWHNDRYSNLKNIPNLNYISMSRQKETGLFAFGTTTGEIVLVDLFSNSKPIILAKVESPIECIKWVGKNLIATSEGKLLMIDASKNQALKSLQISIKPIRHIEISNDEKNLFITVGTETVQVRDAISGGLICKLTSISEMISSITLSPNGKTLAVGTCQGNVTLWNTSDYQIKSIIPAGIN